MDNNTMGISLDQIEEEQLDKLRKMVQRQQLQYIKQNMLDRHRGRKVKTKSKTRKQK